MAIHEWLFEVPECRSEKPETNPKIVEVSHITLTELERRQMAIELFSTFLQCNVWFCSNDVIADQIKSDMPGAVCYTVEELRELIRLAPNPEDLKKIHEAKSIFPNSEVIDSDLKKNTGAPE